MATTLIPWEVAEQARTELANRSRYKDMDLAILLANGSPLEEAAKAIGMRVEFAQAIFFTPMFSRLLATLRKEREESVYNPDPDEAVESEARGNFRTMREARDLGGSMGIRLKAAEMLHNARPSIRKQKLEESTLRVIFTVEDTQRLMEGYSKGTGRALQEVEVEFARLGEEERQAEREAQEEGIAGIEQAQEEKQEEEEVREAVQRSGRAITVKPQVGEEEGIGTITPQEQEEVKGWWNE